MLTYKRHQYKSLSTVKQSTFAYISSNELGSAIYSKSHIEILLCTFKYCISTNWSCVYSYGLTLKCSTFYNDKALYASCVDSKNYNLIEHVEFSNCESEAHTFYISGENFLYKNSNLSSCTASWSTFGRIDSNTYANYLNFANCNHYTSALLLFYSKISFDFINFVNYWVNSIKLFLSYGRGSNVCFDHTFFNIYECERFDNFEDNKGEFEIRNSILIFNFTMKPNIKLTNVEQITTPIEKSTISFDINFEQDFCHIVCSCRNIQTQSFSFLIISVFIYLID